ncbi:MAG TPA: hypothetical protein VGX28_09530 [Frankiaceae bacterium]|jgi:hypothetical protein|nr:hypothetical protein [Frankiaceae bacterium]
MSERTYVLVVRVWTGEDGAVTARVRGQLTPGEEPAYERVTARVEDVPALVGEWLGAVTAR